MKKKKQKGPATNEQAGPKRKDKSKRRLNSKVVGKENQYLLLKFHKDHPGLTFDEAGAILSFIGWLEDNDYIILDAKKMIKIKFEII